MDLTKARCLITGASGFLGTNLIAALVKRGCLLTAVSRNRPVTDSGVVDTAAADLAEPGRARSLLIKYKPDVIFHLAGQVSAAEDPSLVIPMFQANSCATVYLLAAAAEVGCDRVVTVSSAEERAGDLPSLSPYAIAKHVSSTYAEYFRLTCCLPVHQLLLHQAYGPHQSALKLIPYIISSYERGEHPVLGTPQRECDFIYVDDVVAALTMAAECPKDLGVLEVATGHRSSVLEVAEQIRVLLGATKPPCMLPEADRRAPSTSNFDTQRLADSWGWCPRTDLTSGLQKTIDWYKHKRELNDTNCRTAAC